MILTGENRGSRRKTCPGATLSTTNPTWIDPGANPGLRGERPATNRLSHVTARMRRCSSSIFVVLLWNGLFTETKWLSTWASWRQKPTVSVNMLRIRMITCNENCEGIHRIVFPWQRSSGSNCSVTVQYLRTARRKMRQNIAEAQLAELCSSTAIWNEACS
jgi:hypothetical protein